MSFSNRFSLVVLMVGLFAVCSFAMDTKPSSATQPSNPLDACKALLVAVKEGHSEQIDNLFHANSQRDRALVADLKAIAVANGKLAKSSQAKFGDMAALVTAIGTTPEDMNAFSTITHGDAADLKPEDGLTVKMVCVEGQWQMDMDATLASVQAQCLVTGQHNIASLFDPAHAPANFAEVAQVIGQVADEIDAGKYNQAQAAFQDLNKKLMGIGAESPSTQPAH